MTATIEPLRVSSSTDAKKLAGAIKKVLQEHGEASIMAVGAGATYIAIKACIIARGYLAPSVSSELVIIPSFSSVQIEDADKNLNEKTSIKIVVVHR